MRSNARQRKRRLIYRRTALLLVKLVTWLRVASQEAIWRSERGEVSISCWYYKVGEDSAWIKPNSTWGCGDADIWRWDDENAMRSDSSDNAGTTLWRSTTRTALEAYNWIALTENSWALNFDSQEVYQNPEILNWEEATWLLRRKVWWAWITQLRATFQEPKLRSLLPTSQPRLSLRYQKRFGSKKIPGWFDRFWLSHKNCA